MKHLQAFDPVAESQLDFFECDQNEYDAPDAFYAAAIGLKWNHWNSGLSAEQYIANSEAKASCRSGGRNSRIRVDGARLAASSGCRARGAPLLWRRVEPQGDRMERERQMKDDLLGDNRVTWQSSPSWTSSWPFATSMKCGSRTMRFSEPNAPHVRRP